MKVCYNKFKKCKSKLMMIGYYILMYSNLCPLLSCYSHVLLVVLGSFLGIVYSL